MSRDANQSKESSATRVRARLLCATAFCALIAAGAQARSITPTKPSVEVNFEVLKELQATARGTSFAAPVQGRDSISAAPLPPIGGSAYAPPPSSQPQERLAASGRKIPSEQPNQGASDVRRPVNAPFSQASAPLPPVARKPVNVAAKPKEKPAPKPVEIVTPKAQAVPVAKAPVPAPPKPQDEKKLMEALEKEVPAPQPAAAPDLPDIALPKAPEIPDFKPDIALPSPVPTAEPKTAELPPIPALPSPAPDVLVVQKKPEAELPPIPALPAPGETPKADAPLLPSLEKRMDTLFAKQPEKQGVVEDKTTIEDPSVEAKKKADEAEKRFTQQQEAVRQAQLKEQEELKKQAATTEAALLPKPSVEPKPDTSEIAALPTLPTLENKAIPAASDTMDLPPPALPSLTPITGDGAEKSSLDIVQPQEGVAANDTMPSAMQPLDAPEAMPKVTKGEAPALPPIELPAPAEVKKKETKAESLPPIPDFSAMKEEEPEETNVAVAPLPKPEFVKPEIKPQEAPAVISAGSASVSLTFDKDKTDLNDSAKAQLNGLAEQIKSEGRKVRIVSYAAGTAEQASIARRISLSRALQIRAHLIERGVNQLDINVQALGNKEQAERADVYLK